jgi:hypothetical protein
MDARKIVLSVRIPFAPPTAFARKFSGAIGLQEKAFHGLFTRSGGRGGEPSPGSFFSRPLYFWAMVRFPQSR